MTLVVDTPVDGPRIHLLAIGVGRYRHLPGGDEVVPHHTLGLRELSGPPLSALAMVDFVLSRMRHPTATVGTVELLLSPAQTWSHEGRSVAVDVPSMANVRTAFEDWYRRCDQDPEGVGLFYFCGHGVQRLSPLLLLEDFGRSDLAMLENAVDILPTFYGMAGCAIKTQYAFIDACRDVPHQLLERLSGTPRVLIDKPGVGKVRDRAVLFATSGGHKAYGLKDRPTRFTAALIDAFDGLGGRPDGGRWVVQFGGLHNAVTALLRRSDPRAPRQQPEAMALLGDGVLHISSGPPIDVNEGRLTVRLAPVDLPPDHVFATEVISTAPGGAVTGEMSPAHPWMLTMSAGVYLVRASLPTGELLSATAEVGADGDTEVTLSAPPSTGPGSKGGAETPAHVWLRLWRGGDPVDWPAGGAEQRSPKGDLAIRLEVGPGLHSVQLGGDEVPRRVLCLPPAGSCRVLLDRVATEEDFDEGVRVQAVGDDARAESLLRYLASGNLEAARTLAAGLVAELVATDVPPAADAVAIIGYLLLRSPDSVPAAAWREWAGRVGWVPDVHVIRAWTLLGERPGGRPAAARDLLLDGYETGVPRYTEGLRLLVEGLRIFAADDPSDTEVGRAVADVRGYAEACDWASPQTCYWAANPAEPSLSGLKGDPADWHEVMDFRVGW